MHGHRATVGHALLRTTIGTMTSLEMLLVGGPTVRVRYAGLTVLTDPTFDDPGGYPPSPLVKTTPPALTADAVGPVDLVLLSHDQHPDNLDRAGAALLADVPVVLSTPLAAQRLAGVVGLEAWASVRVGRVVVTAVPARHGPPGIEPTSGPVTGFVLEADGWPTTYVSGDNASVGLVAAVAERFDRIDVALLFVGAARPYDPHEEPRTLDAGRALAVARVLDDAVVVPAHAEGWRHFTESVDDLVATFAAAGEEHRLRLLPKGVPVEVAVAAVPAT